MLQTTVDPSEQGKRLDSYLGERPEVGSRAAAQKLIERDLVRVDGRPRQKRYVLQAGERIETFEAPAEAPAPPAGDVAFDIAYEDEHLLIVDKGAGVVVHPAPGHRSGTLSQALAARGAAGGEPWRPGIVHRLDKDTSGLIVVAKSDTVHRALQEAIRGRAITREYHALVGGHLNARSGTIDAPIGRDRRRRTAISTSSDKPRAARTHFEEVERLPSSTLLNVRLETGRTHQIRVHLEAIGHPVLGDPTYGAGAARLGLRRQFLHSRRLQLEHPVTGAPLEATSELPEDLSAALELARVEQTGA
ncbi:MAG: RluA family pseudouridine synthase [Thermoleophilaceae bacterium]|nr:RluA family pseudouridine synthase [Thermoleophilaceae bacterium]